MIKYTSKKFSKVLGLIALSGLSTLINAQTFDWAPAGPIYTAGRARNIIVDKGDVSGNTLYVGSASSGVFTSTNGGIKWAPLDDQGTIRNISYIAQSFDGTLYVATGEGFLRPDKMAKAQVGTGLYKLSGSSLVSVSDATITGTVINRIACHPTNPNIIALATNKGILISQDAGASFNLASGITASANVIYGMDVKFDGNGILYCSVGNERAASPFLNVASLVYKSSDNSLNNFNNITPVSTVLSDSIYGRIELAIAPSNPNVIYASCAKKYVNNSGNSASLQGLFRSANGGSNWGLVLQGSPQLDPLSNGSNLASGDYAHVIVVDPSNSDEIFMGGYSFNIFLKQGGSDANPIGFWAQLGSPFAFNTPYYLHQNIHDIKIVPGNPTKFYIVTDAGIYRSTDLLNVNQVTPPSFQPFYAGLITGQFNSVSIETFPLSSTQTNVPNSPYTPYSGFMGGTGGNGLTYFSGNYPFASQETNYIGGDVYSSEFSKLLPGVALFSTNSGALYRSSNIKNSDPGIVDVNVYSGAISKVAPSSTGFSNPTYTSSGTPFKLWENYGQFNGNYTPDSLVFYNDTLRFQASMIGVATLTTQSTFTFSAARPNKFALIDSIAIRTGTVILPISAPYDKLNTPFTGSDKKDITIKLSNTYTIGTGLTSPPITGTTGAMSAAGVTLDAVSLLDNISVTFNTAPFATKTISAYPTTGTNIAVSDPAAYYRVFATIFYKYKASDTIKITDNSISTKVSNYSKVLTQPLSWSYSGVGSRPAYVLTAVSNTNFAVSNPTYVINPGNISQSSPSFTVNPIGSTTYTILPTGDYSISAIPISYTIAAVSNTAISNPTYVLNPGNISQTTTVFMVTPTVSTNYTITESSLSTTLTQDTYSTVSTSTYVLNPGNISQPDPLFLATVTSAGSTFTIQGLSSNTLSAANTSTNYTLPVQTFSTVGKNTVPFCGNNPLIKIPTKNSARLALALSQSGITNNGTNANAIVVSKAPLNLNDPLSFVRVSQNGCLTSDALGNPTFSTIAIPGKPTLIEWSHKGSELYYATDDNKLYRVSNIYSIMDMSPNSYSGKLSTDIFKYADPMSSSGDTNRLSPYRTTLLGSFTKPITSISITKNDSLMAITFNDPAGTIVSYSSNDIRKSNFSNINFVSKNGSTLGTGSDKVVTYCSLMEKDDSKKMFIGTDNGIYYTSDISSPSPTWTKVNNNKLPNVQIFDIKQQVLKPWECYNSGQIYVATNGRGVWTNNSYLVPYYTSIQDLGTINKENNLMLFPNPTNGDVHIAFNSIEGESATLNVMDINGRTVKSENLGDLDSEVNYVFETSSLSSGIYIVSVNGTSGTKRVAKLIVTK